MLINWNEKYGWMRKPWMSCMIWIWNNQEQPKYLQQQPWDYCWSILSMLGRKNINQHWLFLLLKYNALKTVVKHAHLFDQTHYSYLISFVTRFFKGISVHVEVFSFSARRKPSVYWCHLLCIHKKNNSKTINLLGLFLLMV